VDIGDGDLVRLARTGDAAAFRLLVERHQPSARAHAARLCALPGDVDDLVQESFLQAFVSLARLRDPDRFSAWLAGIVVNVHRATARRAPLTLLADWPEPLHPASPEGLPSAEDLDRAEALRAAVAALPEAQRRAVEQYYYDDLPIGQIAGSPGAAKTSLHKARRRLREYITTHRPDLIPVSRRTPMTTVRIAHAQPQYGRITREGNIRHFLIVLADDAGHRAVPLWLGGEGDSLWLLLHQPPAGPSGQPDPPPEQLRAKDLIAENLSCRLLRAAGVTVTRVDIDELGPGVVAARIEVTSPAGPQQVTASLGRGLALAAAMDAPIQVADALMSRLAVPVTGDDLLDPFLNRKPEHWYEPWPEPRNLAFADGLNGWYVSGSFQAEATGSHWQDYSAAAADGVATLSAAVPHPYGNAVLGQSFLAGNYRGATVSLRAEIRAGAVPSRAVLWLRTNSEPAPPGHLHRRVITDGHDWTRHEVTIQVPGDAEKIAFGLTLTGPGQVRLRNVELARAS
jgi:RNA polymerase sigma factor (sigma-70 family)